MLEDKDGMGTLQINSIYLDNCFRSKFRNLIFPHYPRNSNVEVVVFISVHILQNDLTEGVDKMLQTYDLIPQMLIYDP